MTPPALAPIETSDAPTTTEQVFDALYRAVVTLELPPGARISEADIAARLGVSRQPVRDAFFRLGRLNLLLIRPQRPTRVTLISEAELRRAVFLRAAIETACLRRAARLVDKADLDRLSELVEAQSEAIEAGDIEGFRLLDDDFHRALCKAAQEAHAWTPIAEQKARIDRVRVLTLGATVRDALREHAEIVRALRAGRAAEAALEAHIERIMGTIPGLRAAQPAYFEENT